MKRCAVLCGVRSVDSTWYAHGWNGALSGIDEDLYNIEAILASSSPQDPGFTVQEFRNPTRQELLSGLRQTVASLASGDLLVFYYSGHGGQVPNPFPGMLSPLDVLCLVDGLIFNRELGAIWAAAPAGAQLIAIADSCSSERFAAIRATDVAIPPLREPGTVLTRLAPQDVIEDSYEAHAHELLPFLDAIRQTHGSGEVVPAAELLVLAACADNTLAHCDELGGAFTKGLKLAWSNGTGVLSSYRQLMSVAGAHCPRQTPMLTVKGHALSPDPASRTAFALYRPVA